MADPTAVIAAARELLAEASKYDALIDRRVLYALRAELAAYDAGAVKWRKTDHDYWEAHRGGVWMRARRYGRRYFWAITGGPTSGRTDSLAAAQAAAEAAARGATP